MVTSFINKAMTKIFGSRNERLLKSYRKKVLQINTLEPQMRALSDQQMKELAQTLAKRLRDGEEVTPHLCHPSVQIPPR